jgi:ABC-type protease/lipase transport system fused ATPase/permease subunit
MQDLLQQDAGYKLLMMSMPSRGLPRATPHEPSERAAALNACGNAVVGIGLFSGMSNILMLTGALLMLAGVDAIVLPNYLQQLA